MTDTNDFHKTHDLDKMQTERMELGLKEVLEDAQKGDKTAYLVASLTQSNVFLIGRLKELEARLEKLEGK
ncbi:hypothetical protein BTW10_13065 [Chromohalobacter japonicus]|uniref:Uncharacterized protein n=1 Tax=Chromohalobacter japonicus TaxID=223900 RepID=A0A1Q8TAC1_9GAMM|nr:hypothetical protein [Chromohalobacter japonicus]OLO10631.1 hypothetical protein BTW10_13065 [Chromohalobacter japonicus]